MKRITVIIRETEEERLAKELLRYGNISYDFSDEYNRIRVIKMNNKSYILHQNCGNVISCQEV